MHKDLSTTNPDDDTYMEGFNAGFGEAKMTQDATKRMMRQKIALAIKAAQGTIADCEDGMPVSAMNVARQLIQILDGIAPPHKSVDDHKSPGGDHQSGLASADATQDVAIPQAPVTDEKLAQWAARRADDAGRLARELIAYRRAATPKARPEGDQ